MTKHIPDVVGDDPEDIAQWQESLRKLVPERGEGSRITGATIPSGLPSLDVALVGGWRRGRIVELFGLRRTGKSTVIYHTVATAQRIGGVCALVVVGSRLNLGYAQKIGVNAGELLVARVKTDDEALRLAELLTKSGMVDLVVVDSLTTVMPAYPIEAPQDDSPARRTGQTMRRLVSNVQRTQTLCLISSQTRKGTGAFGSLEMRPGGHMLKFLSSQRLHVKNLETSSSGCARVKVIVAKNSGGPPFRTAMLDIHPGKGVSLMGCLLDLALEMGIVVKLDSGLFYKTHLLGLVSAEAVALLEARPELARQIETEINQQLALEHDDAVRISLPETRNGPRRRLCVALASCRRLLRRLLP
jgi:recombination protein RecA